MCDECNAFFSRDLELPLGRDSAESFFRIEAGVKPAGSAEKFIGRHMRFTVQGTQHFDGDGPECEPQKMGSPLCLMLCPR